ncbi:MAG TPA: hypothetical protein VEI07_06160 [Planctomycetaceae bacterium]|nr:hypothetical protein [Planctomycetaceae bacterium]
MPAGLCWSALRLAALVALLGREKGKRRTIVAAAWLLALTIVLMVADFYVIYVPMVGMITPVGRAHMAEFAGYHRASMIANFADVALCAIAAALLCWPAPQQTARADS